MIMACICNFLIICHGKKKLHQNIVVDFDVQVLILVLVLVSKNQI